MKTLLTFIGLLAIAYTLPRVPLQQQPLISGLLQNDQETVNLQRLVLNLLQNIDQPNSSQEIERIGLSYDIEANIQSYKNPQYVVEFFKLFTVTALPKGQIFSIFNQQHQKEAIAFYRVLSTAVDIDTLYKTAAWGRMFLNEGLYLYSVSVALVHRPDTTNIELPPIYEIYPYYFYNIEVLEQIQKRLGLPLINPQQRSYKLSYYFGRYMQNQGQGIEDVLQRYPRSSQYQQGINQNQVPRQVGYGNFIRQNQGPMGQQGLYQWVQGLLQNQVPIQQQGIPYSQKYFQKYVQLYQGVPTQQYQNQGVVGRLQGMSGQPLGVFGQQQGGLRQQQGVLGQQQGILNQLQGVVGQQQGLGSRQQGMFGQQGVFGQQGIYGQQQGVYGQQQGVYGQQQGVYGQQQGVYGKQQGIYGQQQGIYGQQQGIQQMGQTPITPYQLYLQRLQQGGQQMQIPMVGVNPSMNDLDTLRSRLLKSPSMSQYQQGVGVQEREKVSLWKNSDVEGLTVNAEYTPINSQQNPESLMNYFTEDVGLNAFYYYFNIYFPSWMTNEEINFNTERRGEQFYFIYQQLLARYNLERISNNLPEVPIVTVQNVIESGIQSELVNPNGIPFPVRPNNAQVPSPLSVSEQVYDNSTMALINFRLYESRIMDVIDSGFVRSRNGKLVPITEQEGIEILGNLIESNAESLSPRFYGDILKIARNIWGYSNNPVDENDFVPSVMEQLETSLRDPAFYQLIKKMMSFFQRYQQYIPSYSQEQLLWNGVQIQDVKVDKLVTYFDNFNTDISIAIPTPVPVQIQQQRLNSLPFNYNLNVVSEKQTEAVVRVFLGPKYGVNGQFIDINRERLNFVQLDKFQTTLIPGLNTIQRNSIEFNGVVPDRTSTKDLFLELLGMPQLAVTQRIPLGIPQRLVLPKGTQDGQLYQMYFIITPVTITKSTVKSVLQQQTILPLDVVYDNLSLGYPFDRPIDESVFYVANSKFQDVVIYNEITFGQQGEQWRSSS